MCGRYSLTASPEEIRALFGYDERPNFPPRYNIAPTQPIAIVISEHGKRGFLLARWGLIPSWVKDPAEFSLLINARGETAAEKPAFRGAMRHRRCLVPANGFYEWGKTPSGPKQPYWVAPADGRLIAFAGIWETYAAADGSEIDTAAIITTAANRVIAPIHHRMPAILDPKDFAIWLDMDNVKATAAGSLLKPAPNGLLVATPVSTAVNRVANDGPQLHEAVGRDIAVEEEDDGGTGQLDLF